MRHHRSKMTGVLVPAAVLAVFFVIGCAAEQIAATPADLPARLARFSTLSLPPGPGPFPGMVLISGGGGIGPRERDWARRLTEWGYACLLVDSMSARGLTNREVVGVGRKMLPGPVRAPDAWWGFWRLSGHPRVDRNRIGVMGWSHGAWTVMAALDPAAAPPAVRFAAAVVFYPGCRTGRPEGNRVPVLLLLGGKDDWNPPGPCLGWAEKERRRGARIQMALFPEARHAFDDPSRPAMRFIPRANFGRGATVGFHAESARRAEKMVRDFLARLMPR